jgi:signal transduction histidine kinase/PAS domain-containing protein
MNIDNMTKKQLIEETKKLRKLVDLHKNNNSDNQNAEHTLRASLKLFQMFDSSSINDLTSYALEECVRLSTSKIGYFHFINTDQKTIRLNAWSEGTLKHCSVAEKDTHYPIDKAGVWVDCINHRKPIIHNDYNSLPNKMGLPEGHVPLVREMAVPVFEDGLIVAIIGVGNKDTDYNQFDIDQLTLMAKSTWGIIRRKETELKLHESEKRYRELFNNISSGVAVYEAIDDGHDFLFRDFNAAGENIEGIKKENLLGKRVTEIFPGIKDFGLLDKFQQVWKTGKPVFYPITLYHDNRTMGWRENYIYQLPTGEIVAAYNDVTEKKTAETHQKLLTTILEILNKPFEYSDAIQKIISIIKDSLGFEAVGVRLKEGDDYPYYQTHGFPAVFVKAENNLCKYGLNGEVIKDKNNIPVLECMCGNVIRGKTDHSLPFFTKEGSFWTNCTSDLLAGTSEEERQGNTKNRCNSEGYESVALIPINSGSKTIGLLQLNDKRRDMFTPDLIKFYEGIGVSIGIAFERKQSEEALVMFNSELKKSNEELDEFAYIASHDLKEPLRGIHNYSQFLLEDYYDKIDDDGKSKLKTLPRLTQKMESLIDSLLTYSRLGRTDLAIQFTDLNKILSEVIDSMHISLKEKGINVRVSKALPTIKCDSARISEVFRNLIGNAIKYNDKSDKWIEIGWRNIHCENANKCQIEFYIRDNGIGIKEKHLKSIFRMFKRLHGRDKYGGGTGAGLTIVRKIIERHGGIIQVESVFGEGTTFYFTVTSQEKFESNITTNANFRHPEYSI